MPYKDPEKTKSAGRNYYATHKAERDAYQVANREHNNEVRRNTAHRTGKNLPIEEAFTPERRKQRSIAAKKQFSTLEGRAKASAASKKRYEDPAERERSRVAAKKQFKNPETRKKHADSLKRVYSDPIIQAKMSARAKERWGNPEERRKLRAKLTTPEARSRTSNTFKKLWSDPAYRLSMSGENASQWKGGISFEPYCPKFNNDMRNRTRAYFNNRCVLCGVSRENQNYNLSIHHVEYSKTACCDGKPVHFAALCGSCHGKTNHNREKYEAMLHRIIDEIYGGRSYFTKEEWAAIQRDEKA